METTIVFWGYIGIMEKKMETTIVFWGYQNYGPFLDPCDNMAPNIC